MGAKAAFFNGIWLWQNLEWFDGPPQRSDDPSFGGVRRTRKGHNPESPGFDREISVTTQIARQADFADLSDGTQMWLRQMQLDDELIATSNAEGVLSWCQDQDDRADVGGAGASSGSSVAVPIGGWDSSYVPTVGDLVLVRKPSTGEGFVTSVEGSGGGSITLASVTADLTSDWELRYIQGFLAACTYVSSRHGTPGDASDHEGWRPSVEYRFLSSSTVSYAARHTPPRGNA